MLQQSVLGDYRLLELVGEGGMAEVYRAQFIGKSRPSGMESEVVLKRIKPALYNQPEFPIFREMFLNEARLVHELSHPNLARMHTLGEGIDRSHGGNAQKVPFIVGEYIRGQQLWKLLRIATNGFTGRSVPPGIAALIIREASLGLGYAHTYQDRKTGRTQPIIHRDVAPDNIMLGNDGQVKVIDFGVAKAIGGFGPQTQTGIIKGKLAYLAPEQVTQKVVPATDVFGAGIILYEMLTGRRLFGGANDFTVVGRVLKAEIPPPSRFVVGIPNELEAVLMTALSRDLRVRYENGTVFAQALSAAMQSEPSLRGMGAADLRRWSEELLAEAALAQAPSASDERSVIPKAKSGEELPELSGEIAISGEIELSGDDVIFGGLTDVDPAVREAVSQALGIREHSQAMMHLNYEPTQPLRRPVLSEAEPQMGLPADLHMAPVDPAGKTFDKLSPISSRPKWGLVAGIIGLVVLFIAMCLLLFLR
jgi:serine/threonine-protein kinase